MDKTIILYHKIIVLSVTELQKVTRRIETKRAFSEETTRPVSKWFNINMKVKLKMNYFLFWKVILF